MTLWWHFDVTLNTAKGAKIAPYKCVKGANNGVDVMRKMEKYNGLLKQCVVGNRTVAMFKEGDSWIVEVDYGDGFMPSSLVFDDIMDAETRYTSAIESAGKAYWEADESGDWHCSNCKAIVEADEQRNHNWYYCYHCGKKMRNPNFGLLGW